MPRHARLDAPGTLHHIMIRGIEGTPLFRDDQDREDFLSRIEQLVKKTGTRILAWALMDTHVHLLLFSGQQGIPKFMRCLLTGYAICYNRKHKRSGHLFQNRYKSIVCEEEVYLRELVRYIHLNPLRATKVGSVEELNRYCWSGHSAVLGKVRNEWQEVGYVLRLFSKQRRKAVAAYLRFIEEGKDQGRRPELVGGGLIRSMGGWSQVLSLRGRDEIPEHDARILGSGDFVADMLREAEGKLRRQLHLGERAGVIERIIHEACAKEGVSEQELRKGGRGRKISRVRARVAYELHQEGVPFAEIARYVGVCTSAVVKAISNVGFGKEK